MNKLNIPIYYAVYITSKTSSYFQKRLKYTDMDTYESIEYNKQLEKRELDFTHKIERTREMNDCNMSENNRLNTTKNFHITPTGNRFDNINKSMRLIQEVLKKQT
jgi:hypothetical protein